MNANNGLSRHEVEGGGKPLYKPGDGERHPWEATAIYVANCSVVFFMAVILLFVILDYMPDPKPKKVVVKGTKAGKRDGKYTRAEVALHNSEKDAWIIVNGKVYDVTEYVDEHPGGKKILTNVGGDSTKGFFGPQHPSRVFDIFEDFCVGELVESEKDK